MTSPSLSPRSSISLSGSRAKPRPLSAGGRLATWTLRDLARSIVSVSAILSPDPRPQFGGGTAPRPRGFNYRRQYLIDPAIFRTTERGARRVLAAPTLFIHPVTTTARFLSSPCKPASTTSLAPIATRSNRPLPPKPATSPNSVRVGPGQRQDTLIPCGLSSSCSASLSERTKALVAK